MINKRRIMAFVLAVIMLLDASMITSASTISDEITLINTYVEYLDTGDINNIEMLLCEEEKSDFIQFISNKENEENHIGYFNYKSAELISISECPELISTLNYDINDYSDISSMSAWECIIDINVYRETKYLLNGYNKFIIVLGYKNSSMPVIIGCVRDRVWSEENCSIDCNEMITPSSYDAPVGAPTVGVWTHPSSIVVKTYGTVNFKTYCQKVMATEFGSDAYNENARKAAALAIKDYGWNRTLVQKHVNEEYDVDCGEEDQVYNPNATPSSSVKAAIDSIWNYVALSCDYKLFCTFYVQSFKTSSSIESHAIQHGGVMSQVEANTLGKNGYSWQDILHYFYDYGTYNSEMTSGVIKIVNLTHSITGATYSTSPVYHWITCTTCGCAHTRKVHTWVLSGAKYRCTVCGYTTTQIPSVSSLEY